MVSVSDFGLFTGGCAGGGGVVASRVASGGDARGGVHRLTPGVVQRVIRESGAHRRQTYEMEKRRWKSWLTFARNALTINPFRASQPRQRRTSVYPNKPLNPRILSVVRSLHAQSPKHLVFNLHPFRLGLFIVEPLATSKLRLKPSYTLAFMAFTLLCKTIMPVVF